MKILITGSSGMLGRELCKVFKAENDVVGVDISSPKKDGPDSFYEIDLTSHDSVKGVFLKESPEVIIHAAAWTDVDGCEIDPEKAKGANTEATRNVAEVAKEIGSELIFISTDFVFDGKKKTPYVETDDTNPINSYGRSKWEAEEIVKSTLTRYIIARTSWLYGSGGKNFVDTVLSKIESEEKLRIVDDQVGSPTCTKDLALAIEALIKAKDGIMGEVFHVSNSGTSSWYGFAAEIAKMASLEDKAQIEPIPSKDLERPATRPLFSVLDCSKLKEKTGFQMRPWQEALEEYLKEKD